MAFSPSSTTRWFLRYSVTGDEHVMQLRSTSAATAEQVSDAFGALLASLADNSQLYEVNIIDLSRAATGTNSREPQTWSGDATYGSGAMPEVDSPRFVSFSGRAAGNQQVRIFIYGWIGTSPDDYRLNSGESAFVEDALTVLAASPNVFLSAGLNQPIWKAYSNVGFNAYFQRKQRIIA